MGGQRDREGRRGFVMGCCCCLAGAMSERATDMERRTRRDGQADTDRQRQTQIDEDRERVRYRIFHLSKRTSSCDVLGYSQLCLKVMLNGM